MMFILTNKPELSIDRLRMSGLGEVSAICQPNPFVLPNKVITQLVNRNAGIKSVRRFVNSGRSHYPAMKQTNFDFRVLLVFVIESPFIPVPGNTPFLPMVPCPKPRDTQSVLFFPDRAGSLSYILSFPIFCSFLSTIKQNNNKNIFHSDCPIEKQQTLFVLNNKPSKFIMLHFQKCLFFNG